MNRQELEKPFEDHQIKKRNGSFGQVLSYIENHFVVQRLNDAFEGSWSFEVVSHEIIEDEVVVLGKLTAEGVTKTQFGSSKITRNKEKVIISLGDDCKAAGSNALRKAASLFRNWFVVVHGSTKH